MTSPRKNVAFAALALLILLALFLGLSPGDEDESTAPPVGAAASTPQPSTVTAASSTPAATSVAETPKPAFSTLRSGSVRKIKVKEGDTIRLEAKSAGEEELHVHGYDLSRELPAGKVVRLSFKAKLTGVFEVEFERSAEPIAEITVEP